MLAELISCSTHGMLTHTSRRTILVKHRATFSESRRIERFSVTIGKLYHDVLHFGISEVLFVYIELLRDCELITDFENEILE